MPLNKLQCLVVQGILDHIIKNKSQIQVVAKDQLLLYVRSKDNFGKSWIFQALEIRFIFLNKQKELVISALTDCTANCIRRNITYIALEINTQTRKKIFVKINILYLQCLSLIINKVSIIEFKFLILIGKQLQKARRSDISSTLICGGLL